MPVEALAISGYWLCPRSVALRRKFLFYPQRGCAHIRTPGVEQVCREGLVAPAVVHLKLTFTWSIVVETDAAEALTRLAEDGKDAGGAGVFGGCDVIAMATHGRSGLTRLALGSITERVLHATRLPLLVVRPPEMIQQVSSPMTIHHLAETRWST